MKRRFGALRSWKYNAWHNPTPGMTKEIDMKSVNTATRTDQKAAGLAVGVNAIVGHCRPDFLQWEQRNTCCKCAAPLADNPLVKDAYKMNTVNAWAKGQLNILADMAEHRGMQWFAYW